MIPKTKKSVINDFDIMMYVALGLKHLRLMVLLVCLCLMLGLTYYTFARPVYHSKALVAYQSLARPLDVSLQDGFDPEVSARREEVMLLTGILAHGTRRAHDDFSQIA